MAKPKEFQEVVGSIPKGDGDEIRVTAGISKDKPYIDLRFWYKDDDGDMQPTKKGVRFHAEMVEDVLNLIGEATDLIDNKLGVGA